MSRPFPSDDEIGSLLRDRVDVSKRAVGAVIGIVDSSGPRTIACGHPAKEDPGHVSSETIFELGCVTKVLTGLLCADMIEQGEVDLADRIAGDLPPHVPSVGRNGVAITVEHLITHTSGLPHHAVDVYDPIDRVFDWLCAQVPTHEVGSYYEYSTAGFSVLGHVLESRAGSSHARLVRDRICEPLQMTDTVVEVPRQSASRVSAGHDAGLMPVGPFRTPTVTGGYGFHSTAADLLRLLAACAGLVATPLEAAIERIAAVRHKGALEDVGMAWHVNALNGIETISHEGNSYGHRTFVGFVPRERRGVVALVNAVTPVGVTDICRHLLNRDYPLLPTDAVLLRPSPESMGGGAVRLDSLDRFVGVYQMTPNCRLMIDRDGDALTMSNGVERRQIVPLSACEFWLPGTGFRPDGVVRFEFDGDGQAASMTVPDRGFERKFVRFDERSSQVWHGRRAGEEGPRHLEQYVGCYHFGEFLLEIRCIDERLWAGWISNALPSSAQVVTTGGTGRPHELLHERDHRFFLKSDRFDMALVFEPGADADIVAVTCRMSEKTERGVRMPAMVA